MRTVAQLNRSARFLAAVCTPLALAAMLTPTAASAQISETVTISSNYGTAFPPLVPSSTAGGTKETHYLGSYAPGQESELGVNYTATADANGFFFLHDNFCVGGCNTISDTTIIFNVTNTGDGVEPVWFHSQITPGHIAEIFNGGSLGSQAGFNFTVSRSFGDGSQVLYSASGGVNSDGIFLETGGLNYNGLLRQTSDNFDLLDWQATNLSIDAGRLTGFQSMQIIYRATYFSSSSVACDDVLLCPGAQVVFGDPRNNGGVILSSAAFSAASLLNAPPPIDLAVIGGLYGQYFVPVAFTDNGTSPFEEPTLGADLNYNQLYRSRLSAIPEPESWALMILGFGAAGAAMRRQRSRPQLA